LSGARKRRQHAEAVVLKDATSLGQRDGETPPIEQAGAAAEVELCHALGEGRLAQMDHVGRASEAARPRHGKEHLDLADRGLHSQGLVVRMKPLDANLWKASSSRRRGGGG